MSEQAAEFVKLATQAIQDQQFVRALELVDQATSLDPNNSDAYTLKGIALAQTNQPDGATAAFRQAIAVAPNNAKAYYNLATHQYQLNSKDEAYAMAQEALRIDPTHAAARDLVTLLEQERGGLAPTTPTATGSPYGEARGVAPQSPYIRAGYEQPVHSIAFVEGLGKKWPLIAWILVAVSLGVLVTAIVLQAPFYSEMFKNLSNPQAIQEAATAMQAKTGVLGTLLSIASWGSVLLILTWMIMDLIDRRGNWLWIAPLVICSCCGLGWMVLPVYLVAGRK